LAVPHQTSSSAGGYWLFTDPAEVASIKVVGAIKLRIMIDGRTQHMAQLFQPGNGEERLEHGTAVVRIKRL
jgi:hypothetical protein